VGLSGCKSRKREVVVYTSVDQVFSEPIFKSFEHDTGTTVRAVFDTEETKSTGVLNRLVSEGQNPQADVFWSGDPVRPYVLIKRGLIEPYQSPKASGDSRSIPGDRRNVDRLCRARPRSPRKYQACTSGRGTNIDPRPCKSQMARAGRDRQSTVRHDDDACRRAIRRLG
jgi:hypothetical protein